MTLIRKIFTICICLLLALQLPVSALAEVIADVSFGNVSIYDTTADYFDTDGTQHTGADHGGSVTVTGSTKQNNITVNVSAGNTVEVTLQDVNIDRIGTPIWIEGEGNVVVELDGDNSLTSDSGGALVTSDDGGSLTIQDENSVSGSLTVKGGGYGAGIGGANNERNDASNITITGGTIDAKGGSRAAGIGGAVGGSGSNITITGDAKVKAESGEKQHGAGIGGGVNGTGSNITISGDAKVTAIGGAYAADIGNGGQEEVLVKPENNVDTSFLTPNGSVNGVPGTYVPPAPPAPTGPFVLNRDYTQTKQDGVLTVTVKGEDAVLTIKTWGIEQLIAQGIHTLVLVTDKAETALDLNELVEFPGTYVLKHKGTETTLTRGGEIVK